MVPILDRERVTMAAHSSTAAPMGTVPSQNFAREA